MGDDLCMCEKVFDQMMKVCSKFAPVKLITVILTSHVSDMQKLLESSHF